MQELTTTAPEVVEFRRKIEDRLRRRADSWAAIARELGVGEGTVRRAAEGYAKNNA